jgi:hypothetical protein
VTVTFDYIIAVDGIAGLSHAFYSNENRMRDKKTHTLNAMRKTKMTTYVVSGKPEKISDNFSASYN